jgi:hypothetical protein
MGMNVGLLTLTVAGFLGLMASCSSDSDDGDESSAGTSSGSGGRAGAATGGSKNGGSSATAGTSSNGGSSNPTAGNTGSGGFNVGGFNLGGAGFDPDDYACNPVPQPGSSCDSGAQPCINGTEVCYCNADEWACMDVGQGAGGAGPGGGFGDIECPATKPMNGGDCGDTVGFCPYGGQFMGCACYDGAWACN